VELVNKALLSFHISEESIGAGQIDIVRRRDVGSFFTGMGTNLKKEKEKARGEEKGRKGKEKERRRKVELISQSIAPTFPSAAATIATGIRKSGRMKTCCFLYVSHSSSISASSCCTILLHSSLTIQYQSSIKKS
jgi:hypothetical protein